MTKGVTFVDIRNDYVRSGATFILKLDTYAMVKVWEALIEAVN